MQAGGAGYVQRLAVDPAVQRAGAWARPCWPTGCAGCGWGARDALVNTQEGNERSLRLYQRAGFVLQPDGLAVLRLSLEDPG